MVLPIFGMALLVIESGQMVKKAFEAFLSKTTSSPVVLRF